MERVGVRELRQNASKLLERVERGESLEVTNHGRAVARLVPITIAQRLTWQELREAGVLRVGHGDPLEVPPQPTDPDAPSTEQILEELRAE